MQNDLWAVEDGTMKKFLYVVLAIMVAVIALKVVFAIVSALFGLAVFAVTVALLGFGAVAVYRHLTGSSRQSDSARL